MSEAVVAPVRVKVNTAGAPEFSTVLGVVAITLTNGSVVSAGSSAIVTVAWLALPTR